VIESIYLQSESLEMNANNNNNVKKNSFYNQNPYAEIHVLGPHSNDQMKSRIKIINHNLETNVVEFDQNDSFSFKLKILKERILNDKNYMDDYEIQIVVRETPKLMESSKIIGMAVLNLNEILNAAIIWKRLIEKEKDYIDHNLNDYTVFGCLDCWLNLRSRIKIDINGVNILKVLDKHLNDRQAISFVKLKSISRE